MQRPADMLSLDRRLGKRWVGERVRHGSPAAYWLLEALKSMHNLRSRPLNSRDGCSKMACGMGNAH
jgi:hypothetical protein